MRLSKLHIITNDLDVIEQCCEAGAEWIQLRMKNMSEEEMREKALLAWEICNDWGAKLIINDHVQLALAVKANGVHLGTQDMAPQKARELLGPNAIIGGTANTLDDIVRLSKEVDYIGLGPIKHTTTKKNLSPIIGLEGLQQLLEQLRHTDPDIQNRVIVIGGITTNDVLGLMQAGAHGVAVSGAITQAENIGEATRAFTKQLDYGTTCYC